jgi:lysozyme family protein
MNLQTQITLLIQREGGFTDNPTDKGGPTNFGITEAAARAFGFKGAMQALPRDIAAQIYTQRFWMAPKFNLIADISSPIADELLDTGVNMGPGVASKFLQRALCVLGYDVTQDGQLGPSSRAALQSFLIKRGKDGEATLLRMLNALQSVRYIELAEADPSQVVFEYGWQLNRTGALS